MKPTTRRRAMPALAFLPTLLACATQPAGSALASEPFEKVTRLRCEHCHRETREEFREKKITGHAAVKNLLDCGKDAHELLKKQRGFRPLKPGDRRTPAETRRWAGALADEEWRCRHQSGPGKPLVEGN